MKLKKQKRMNRGAGVLLPVSCLPSPYGIGTFGKAAYDFVDFLKAAGQKYWQILPLGPIGCGDSPYQSFSAFAGNPYYIDLDILIAESLLTKEQVAAINWGTPGEVDYQVLYDERFKLLRSAYKRSRHKNEDSFLEFCRNNEFWLEDYCTYMAVKTHFCSKEWLEWPRNIKLRKPGAMAEITEQLKADIDFWMFCQYKFFDQWMRLKKYANQSGVEIIGDIPIYVAMDSADVWVHGELFDLDKNRRPNHVAGVPPDLFSETGQLWGNPLYNWDRMKEDGFSWWKARIRASAKIYDVIRIDHFIGTVRYYSVPADQDTALNGVWQEGPGEDLIRAISSAIGGKRIIAENLGILTPRVRMLLEKSGYPGMKLLEMAFENGSGNEYLPFHYEKNCVVYGGTHDNETLAGFFSHQKKEVQRFAREFLHAGTDREIPWAIIYAAYQSVADTVIFSVQDLLGLDNSARINTPSTIGCNWKWRLASGQLTAELAQKMKRLTVLYGR